MEQKSCGPMVCVDGFSVSLRSPRVASSSVRPCSVSAVWLTTSTELISYFRVKGVSVVVQTLLKLSSCMHSNKHVRGKRLTVKQDIILVDMHIGLGVDRVGES